MAATEHDDPRAKLSDAAYTESLEAIAARTKSDPQSPDIDLEAATEQFDLPGADLSGEQLTVRVVAKLDDEFLCTGCFLVHHRSRRHCSNVCVDCAIQRGGGEGE